MLDALHSILFYRLPSYVNPVEGPLEHPHTECNFYNKNTIPPDLSFEAVVSNTAMPPASLLDFVNYLRFVSHDCENLQFYLWLQDYKTRFEALSSAQKSLSPPWKGGERSTGAFAAGITKSEPNAIPVTPASMEQSTISFPGSATRAMSAEEAVSEANTKAGLLWQPFTCQPMRDEINRVVANYIVPDAPRELNLSQRDRTVVLHALQHTTHPSAFGVAEQLVGWTLKTQAHPNFLRWSIGNANFQREILGKFMAVLMFVIGVGAAFALTMSSLPRWYRILAAIPFGVGVFFVLSVRSGLCPILYLKGQERQLPPWEVASLSSKSSTRAPSLYSKLDEENGKGPTATVDEKDSSNSIHSSTMDPFGGSNDFSDEPWIKPYNHTLFVRKMFYRTGQTKEMRLRMIRDKIMLQCVAWTCITAPLFALLFTAVPSGRFY